MQVLSISAWWRQPWAYMFDTGIVSLRHIVYFPSIFPIETSVSENVECALSGSRFASS